MMTDNKDHQPNSLDFVRFVYSYNTGMPIQRVAFYDRAASKKDKDNWIRQFYAQSAREFAQARDWQIVSPEDSVCFVEVCGVRTKKRPVLESILQRTDVDTVAVVAIDKLAKGAPLYGQLVDMVGKAGKNLIIIQNQIDVDFEQENIGIMDAFLKKVER